VPFQRAYLLTPQTLDRALHPKTDRYGCRPPGETSRLALPLTLPSRSLTRPVRAPSVGVVRRLFVLALFAGVWVVAVPPSWAGTIVANVADGILTVNGTTEGDDIAVRCESGRVTVNHDHPSGGPTACADLRRILVFAGEGPDRVSLVDVTPTAFDRLTATSVSGQLEDDALIGSEIGDDLIGGAGVDSLMGGGGREAPVRAGEGRSAAKVATRSRWPAMAIGRSTIHDRGSCRPTRSRG
jgi:hypothetical protein